LYFKYGFLNYESGVCMSSVIEKVLSSKLGEVEMYCLNEQNLVISV
jgi:hypothetical protein